jgi:hypothetical protein
VRSGSRRSLERAEAKAGLPPLEHIEPAQLGVRFLELLVAGVDHVYVGRAAWYDTILHGAPTEGHR